MTRRDPLASLPASVRAINPTLAKPALRARRIVTVRVIPAVDVVRVTIDGLRLTNGANAREHWATKARRAKRERGLILRALASSGVRAPRGPWCVEITRVAPRRMDSDGATIACKHLRDGVADWLAVDDGADAVTFAVDQRKGEPREYAVRIVIATRGPVEASETPAVGVVATSGRPKASAGAAGAVGRRRRGA